MDQNLTVTEHETAPERRPRRWPCLAGSVAALVGVGVASSLTTV